MSEKLQTRLNFSRAAAEARRSQLLLCLPVLRVELVDVVIIQGEWLAVSSRLCDSVRPVLDGLVEESVADEVDEPVSGHSGLVLCKQFGMFLNE